MPPQYSIREFRRIRVELAEIKDLLSHCPGEDSLTQQTKLWCDTFEKLFLDSAEKNIDLQPAIQYAIAAMQRIFRCALPPHGLLDQNALLGCDGRVYSPEALRNYRMQTAKPFCDRSPFDPNNAAPLTTTHHPLAPWISRWLAGYGVFARVPAVAVHPLSPTPAPQPLGDDPQLALDLDDDDDEEMLAEELLKRLQEARERREEKVHNETRQERVLTEFEREIRTAVAAEVERHEAAMRQIASEHHAHLDVLENKIDGLAAQVTPAVNALREANQKLAEDTAERRKETEGLKERLQRVDVQITANERAAAELKIEVNQLHERINERENERNDSLITAIVIVAACVIVALLLPPAAGAAAGAGGAGGAGAGAAGAGSAAGAAGGAAAGAAGAGSAAGAAGAAGASSAAGAGAAAGAAATVPIVPGLRMGVAPVTGGGKVVLNFIW